MNFLFLDIGGVILTNGWDRHMREEAARVFHLDYEIMTERHNAIFDIYELGKISLDEYLDYVIFYQPRKFSKEQFKEFMFAQSQPYPDMLNLISQFKRQHDVRIVAVSNEGRELMLHRIQSFKLNKLIDFFVCSCFVHLRKPDPEIFEMALDFTYAKPNQVIYVDDRLLSVEVAQQFGMHGIHHTSLKETQNILNESITLLPKS